jgi:hypothetical protein
MMGRVSMVFTMIWGPFAKTEEKRNEQGCKNNYWNDQADDDEVAVKPVFDAEPEGRRILGRRLCTFMIEQWCLLAGSSVIRHKLLMGKILPNRQR